MIGSLFGFYCFFGLVGEPPDQAASSPCASVNISSSASAS